MKRTLWLFWMRSRLNVGAWIIPERNPREVLRAASHR